MAEPGLTPKNVPQARVLAVELDRGVVCQSLSTELRIALLRVQSFGAAAIALSKFRPNSVIVALDAEAPDEAGEVRRIRQASDAPVLVVTPPSGERRVTGLIKAGAAGYLFSNDLVRLPVALEELSRGGVPMSEAVAQLVLGRARRSSAKMAAVRPAGPGVEALLTPRQQDILRLLAEGHSYEQIGLTLGLSVNTIRTHVRTLYERLGVSTKVEAVMVAVELGWLARPPPRA